MANITIKPCPFCGDADPAIDETGPDVWAVCCNGCGAIGPGQDDDGSATVGMKAIELWNRRPSGESQIGNSK
jgi:Lar family restriction alleviation protein